MCSEKKGADWLLSYPSADLHLCFVYTKCRFCYDMAEINFETSLRIIPTPWEI